MEARLLIAYGLIALMAFALTASAIVLGRRRAKRRRRLRGIKTDEVSRFQRRSA